MSINNLDFEYVRGMLKSMPRLPSMTARFTSPKPGWLLSLARRAFPRYRTSYPGFAPIRDTS